jgi:hypothetical protein
MAVNVNHSDVGHYRNEIFVTVGREETTLGPCPIGPSSARMMMGLIVI